MQVLVVGGEHAFVHGTFASKLNAVGVDIGAHWDWTLRRPPQVVPKGCKGVVVLHDMVGHHLSNAAKDAAATAGVPFALVPRKFSAALPVLQQMGIVSETATVQADDTVEVVNAVSVIAKTMPITPARSSMANKAELQSWLALVLESDFTAQDKEVAEKATEFVNGVPRSVIDAEVPRVRESMRKEWASNHRSTDAERTLRSTAQAWMSRSAHDPDDPLSLSRIRAEARSLFGVPVPDDVLLGAGFQMWELKGLMTRERVRKSVRGGDSIIAGMTHVEFDAFRTWVCGNGKENASRCPLTVSLKGQPTEGITVVLRAAPDLGPNAAARVYQKMTGASLGPYYHTAVVWALSQFPNPASKFYPAATALSEVVATAFDDVTVEEEPLLVRLTRALFGDAPVPDGTDIVAVATEAKAVLDAVNAAAASLADGGDTSAVDVLVRGKAADIVSRRDLDVVEAKRLQAEDAMKAAEGAFRRAQEEYLLAQGVADETRSRITSLRGQ